MSWSRQAREASALARRQQARFSPDSLRSVLRSVIAGRKAAFTKRTGLMHVGRARVGGQGLQLGTVSRSSFKRKG